MFNLWEQLGGIFGRAWLIEPYIEAPNLVEVPGCERLTELGLPYAAECRIAQM
jgi:hypothetical protein